MDTIIIVVALMSILQNHEAATEDAHQFYNHIARRRQASSSLVDEFIPSRRSHSSSAFRRFLRPYRRSTFDFDPHEIGGIIGAPSRPEHLPAAEPILPGHTLIRPAMGMLKSAVKFPHRELENGFGVDGNWNNLGLRWDGKNERVLYTGFRRMPAEYIMLSSTQDRNNKNQKPSYTYKLSDLILDLDNSKDAQSQILKRLKELKQIQKSTTKSDLVVVFASPLQETTHRERFHKKGNSKNDNASVLDENLRYLLLRYKNNLKLRYIPKKKPNILRTEESSEELPDEILNTDINNAPGEKKPWIWQNQELFNTISQNSVAVPDITQMNLPIGQQNTDQEKPWWFYNQDDFRPFQA